ncbi:MAG: 4-alpha-glucanotransferase [Bryobacteraceae bacterium]
MSDVATTLGTPLFPDGYRAAGLLLHITSLPSPYGIGDLGPAAFTWIDRLREAEQSWWQALPLGPTGYGNSPYQSPSSFVGNGLVISPEFLIDDGLLNEEDCQGVFSSGAVDYDTAIPYKHRLLDKAWTNFRAGARKDLVAPYEQFCHSRSSWLDEYALFRALKEKFSSSSYLEWPKELVQRTPSALTQARRELAAEIDKLRLAQFLLFRQALRLKEYARTHGVRLIGDLPFFVSPDSSDVWANPELFLLDNQQRPRFVAGVPPDYFSARGQLWGNPVYDWKAHEATGYAWCIDRIRALLMHVDVIRLDHFRAFAAAWHVPQGALTAETGEWVPGPGAKFFNAVQKAFGKLPFIAEDLGVLTPDVLALRDEFRLPGTKVLQFAFDGNPDNVHLPENYTPNNVVYTGTHDNATSREWFEDLTDREQRRFWANTGRAEGEIRDAAPELIRLAWSSRATLAITPLQDVLNLGREGRMNVPGEPEGNWRWRAMPHMLSPRTFESLAKVTTSSGRLPSVQSQRGQMTKATQLLSNLGQSI